MIRFALVVASVLGFVLTAALGNMMVPLLRELQRAARGTQPDSDAPDSPVPTMGGLCLMVGTLAAVGVGWLAACAAQPSLLGSDRQMTSRLLIALLGSLAFGAVGLADDLARIRGRYPNGLGLGLRRTQRLALECIAAALVLGLLALNGCLPTGLILPGAGYVECALAPLLWAVLLVAMADPQPKVLNFTSVMTPSFTLIYMRMMSPHLALPTSPMPSASSILPRLRGC